MSGHAVSSLVTSTRYDSHCRTQQGLQTAENWRRLGVGRDIVDGRREREKRKRDKAVHMTASALNTQLTVEILHKPQTYMTTLYS